MCEALVKHRNVYMRIAGQSLRLHYLDQEATTTVPVGIILLIHGFPQTSYQFRHVMTPLARAGYRVIVPDYRGAGESSHPTTGYDKVTMASDLYQLITQHLGISERIHIVGHDIGAMVAFAYATQYPERTASIVWGECPLPGSAFYDQCKTSIDKFHFIFHQVPDGLPEALVSGRERIYLKQFFDRQIVCTDAFDRDDFEHYVYNYSLPHAMRAAFDVYRAFEQDKERNLSQRDAVGKSTLPNMVLSGEKSDQASGARQMAEEFFENVQENVVEGSAHYIAEENPTSFVSVLVSFYASL